MSAQEAEGAYAILPEIAWKVRQTESKSLSPHASEQLIESLASRRALRKTSLYQLLSRLRDIGLLSPGEDFSFKYGYVYQFFLSNYISDHLDRPDMRDFVQQLCRDVSSKESATTLAFLAFHSNDRIISDTIIEGLRTLYQDVTPFEFTKDRTMPVNRLLVEAPKLIIHPEAAQERQHEWLSSYDEEEQANERLRGTDNGQIGSMLNVFTSIEILGHIVRNHYAKLNADEKSEIVTASCEAVLRCIGEIFDHFSSCTDNLLIAVRTFASRFVDEAADEADKEREARRAIFIIAVGFMFYCFRQLSRAIGDENLEVTYEQILSLAPSLTAKFTDVIVKLDAFREFPFQEVKEVMHSLKGDHVGETALRLAVAERLDMRPPSKASDTQRYCDAAGLKLQSRLVKRAQQQSSS